MSMMTSADSRRLSMRIRSSAMPSRIVPFPCSGCGLRTASKRLTSAWSVASRNRTRRLIFLDLKEIRCSFNSLKNSPPRTSITTASRGKGVLAKLNRSAIGSSICGGRLSTTYQPRSSRALPTVDLPAPDMPVTSNSSCFLSAAMNPPTVSACCPL